VNEAFRILGRTQLRLAGRFESGHAKHWLILGALLAQPGRQVPFSALLDWVWPAEEERPQNVQRTFHTYSRRIRIMLGNLDVSAQLIARNNTMRLVVDRLLIDYHRFRDLIDQARRMERDGEPRQARDIAAEAVRLWAGPPLIDLQSAHAESWRRNVLLNHWIPANVLLVKLHLLLGEADQAIARLDDVQDDHPDHVALAKQRIMALWQLDRRPDADDYYFALRRNLVAGAQDDAADDLRRFHDQVRRNGTPAHASLPIPVARMSTRDDLPVLLGLPHVVSDFVGRERLLARLNEAATEQDGGLRATVVCLDGTSGVGKTAVATMWARRRYEEHGDGVVFVDLRGFSSDRMTPPVTAVDELLRVLDFPVDRIDSAAGRAAKLRELLSARRMVVVLDNVRDSQHVLPLLRLLSNCFVLITSRQRLVSLEIGSGARSLTVQRLPQGDAIDLIASRIGDRAIGHADSVAQLAELCEGLALTLTLVTHQIAPRWDVPLSVFVDHFRDPAVLLALGGGGDGVDSSLRMAFASSYQALPASERRIFRLLSLHPGPEISLLAAATLTGLSTDDCQRGLNTLVDAHLIEQRGSLDRCVFHDLIRAYAASLAATEESDADRHTAERRMLDFYVHSAHRADRMIFAHRNGIPMPDVPDDVVAMWFADERSAAEWCVRERANLMAAVRLSAERGFWVHSLTFPHVIGGTWKRYGLRLDLVEVLDKGLAGARAASRPDAEGATLNDRGQLALENGDIDEARKLFHLATYLAQSTHSVQGVAVSRCNLARLDVLDGKADSGIDHYQAALQMATDSGNVHLQAVVIGELGDVFRARKQYEKALTQYQLALQMHRSGGNVNGQVEALTRLAGVYFRRGMHNDRLIALEYARQALEISPPVVDIDIERRARLMLADVLLVVGQVDEAVEQSSVAVTLARRTRAVLHEATGLDGYARALFAAGHRSEAISAWQQCAAIHQDRGDSQRLAVVRDRLAELARLPDAVPGARDDSEPTVSLRRRAGNAGR
jgi:tetratricopeptide (TPR) repeat protein